MAELRDEAAADVATLVEAGTNELEIGVAVTFRDRLTARRGSAACQLRVAVTRRSVPPLMSTAYSCTAPSSPNAALPARSRRLSVGSRKALRGRSIAQSRRTVVGEYVAADERRPGGSAVDAASDDRASLVVAVLGDRQRRGRILATRSGAVAVAALHPVPAEVRPAGLAGPLDIDLLPRALADVADPEIAGGPVEAQPPRARAGR